MSTAHEGGRVFEIVYRSPELVLARAGVLFTQCWRGTASGMQVRRMYDEQLAFIRSRPARTTLSLAHIAALELRPPDDLAREVIRMHNRDITPNLGAGATVVDAQGFAGAMVRGVISGLSLLNAQRQVVVPNVRAGLAHLLASGHGGPGMVLDDVVTAYRAAIAD